MNPKIISAILIMSLAVPVMGCARSSDDVRRERSGIAGEPVPVPDTAPPPAAAKAPAKEQVQEEETPEIISYDYEYREAVSRVKSDRILPDKNSVSINEAGDILDVDYCVTDIDGDGINELLLRYAGTELPEGEDEDDGQAAAPDDAFEAVYEYRPDTETFVCELYENAGILWYDNGCALAPWRPVARPLSDGTSSQNIYEYDPVTDTYIYAGYTDCWDRAFRSEDYDGNPWPERVEDTEDPEDPGDAESTGDNENPEEALSSDDGELFAIQYYSEYDQGYIYSRKDLNSLYKKIKGRKAGARWKPI